MLCIGSSIKSVTTRAPELTNAFCKSRLVNVVADCRAMISVNRGCLNVPGDGGKLSVDCGTELVLFNAAPGMTFCGVDTRDVEVRDMISCSYRNQTRMC